MKNMMLALVFCGALLAGSLVAHADGGRRSLNAFVVTCTSKEVRDAAYCFGFLMGAWDAIAVTEEANKIRLVCMPEGKHTSPGELRSLVVAWAASHPASGTHDANEGVFDTFTEHFPCKPK